MSSSSERRFRGLDGENEFLIPPSQPGSIVDNLAPAGVEHVVIMPNGNNVVVLVGPVDEGVIVRRVRP